MPRRPCAKYEPKLTNYDYAMRCIACSCGTRAVGPLTYKSRAVGPLRYMYHISRERSNRCQVHRKHFLSQLKRLHTRVCKQFIWPLTEFHSSSWSPCSNFGAISLAITVVWPTNFEANPAPLFVFPYETRPCKGFEKLRLHAKCAFS